MSRREERSDGSTGVALRSRRHFPSGAEDEREMSAHCAGSEARQELLENIASKPAGRSRLAECLGRGKPATVDAAIARRICGPAGKRPAEKGGLHSPGRGIGIRPGPFWRMWGVDQREGQELQASVGNTAPFAAGRYLEEARAESRFIRTDRR